MTWSEVIGQEEAKERLMQMVREDRLPHAMMLCGPVGSGKLALAIAFACELLRGHGGTEARGRENTSTAESFLVPPYPRTPVPPHPRTPAPPKKKQIKQWRRY